MKISRLILITLLVSAYATFSVVTIQVANRQNVVTFDVTLDLVDIMTKAFDMSGGGEHFVQTPTQQDAEDYCFGGEYEECGVLYYNGITFEYLTNYGMFPNGKYDGYVEVFVLPEVTVIPCNCECEPPWEGEENCPVCCPTGGPHY